jgi:hypothetical protein
LDVFHLPKGSLFSMEAVVGADGIFPRTHNVVIKESSVGTAAPSATTGKVGEPTFGELDFYFSGQPIRSEDFS